jgi:hypothetical protein
MFLDRILQDRERELDLSGGVRSYTPPQGSKVTFADAGLPAWSGNKPELPTSFLFHGKPFFAGPRPPLRRVTSDRIAGGVMRLTCVPA